MIVITRALLFVALCAPALAVPRSALAAAPSPAACGTVAILLAGYNTRSADVPGTFRDILSATRNKIHYTAPPIDFSYRFPAPYSASDTYNALPSQAVRALHRTIAQQLTRCPNEHIDLIGHSLGGVVALHYLSIYGTSPEGRHVLHAITLDSPVNGTSHARLVLAAALLGQSRLVGSPTGVFLAREAENGVTRASNVSLVARLAPTTTVTTLASTDDWIVPPGDAEIAGSSVELHLGRNYAACARGVQYAPSCLGHDRILHDSRALSALVLRLSAS